MLLSVLVVSPLLWLHIQPVPTVLLRAMLSVAVGASIAPVGGPLPQHHARLEQA